MVKEYSHGIMEMSTKEDFNLDQNRDLEYGLELTEILTLEIGKKISQMDMDLEFGNPEINIKDNGNKGLSMAME